MRKVVLLSPLLVITFISLINTPASKTNSQLTTQSLGKNSGAIEGIVITNGGEPVSKARVYVMRLSDSNFVGRRNVMTANDLGRFSLSNLPDGEYTIRAFKEEDGYPDLTFYFYSAAYDAMKWPRVTVTNGNTVQDVVVHVPSPKCGRLLITVIDAETNKTIRDAEVSLTHEGTPQTLFRPGATKTDGSFDLLIPPAVPIDLKVSAPGYRDWYYKTDGSKGQAKTLLLASDTTKELNVILQPQR
jgi:hypothetical protein